MSLKRVCIVGVGLIGGSLALVLKKKKITSKIVGFFRNKTRLKKALSKGIVDEGFLDLSEAVEGSDLVVLAVPVEKIIEVLKRIKPVLKRGSLVIDVGSTKSQIIKTARRNLCAKVDFVGTHPLAGSEKAGFENASSDIFSGSICIICNDSPATKKSFALVRNLWKAVGCRIVYMSSSYHDRVLAYTSHLPHLISYALSKSIPREIFPYSAGGLKSMLRIAKSNPYLWEEIFFANKTNVISGIRRFRKFLDKFEEFLKNDDRRSLKELLISSRRNSLNL